MFEGLIFGGKFVFVIRGAYIRGGGLYSGFTVYYYEKKIVILDHMENSHLVSPRASRMNSVSRKFNIFC